MRNVAFFLVFVFLVLAFGDDQTVNVRGKVICDRRAVANVEVELREHDTFDPDDSLAKTTTDEEGNFEISGTESEITSIKPYIRVTHDCDVKETENSCHRVSDYYIPEKAINGGDFDMHFINLNVRGHSDEKYCD